MAQSIHKTEAEYTPHPIEFYQDNPLIEALPCYLEYGGIDILKMLSASPERPHPEAGIRQRSEWLFQLSSNLFIPLVRHYELASLITALILQGYENRQPVNGQYVSILQRAYHERQQGNLDEDFGSSISYSPLMLSLIGAKGIGKTRALEQVMNAMYPQVIHHNSPDMGAVFDQVVYLKADVPSGSTVKTLCMSILSELSRVTGNSYADGIRKNTKLESLRSRLESLCNAHCVGIIILDEAQNLLGSQSPKTDKTELFNFIAEFSNTVNAPIIFAGTPKILEICQQEMSGFGTMGCLQWDRMRYRDRDWNEFVGELWKYNVLPFEVPVIPEEIEETLYDLSQGIPDILVKLFILTQMRTLAVASELTEQGRPVLMYRDTIQDVHDDCFGAVKPMTEILRSGDSGCMAKIADMSLDYAAFDKAFEKAMKQESAIINENCDDSMYEEPDQKLLLAGMAEQLLLSMKVAVTDEIRNVIRQYLDENEEAAVRDTVSAALDYVFRKTGSEQNG
jgi:hypothetical protein